MENHNKVVSGLLFGILTSGQDSRSQEASKTLLEDLSSIVRDHYDFAVRVTLQLVQTSFNYLLPNTVTQMVWFCEQLIPKKVRYLTSLYLALFKEIHILKKHAPSVRYLH